MYIRYRQGCQYIKLITCKYKSEEDSLGIEEADSLQESNLSIHSTATKAQQFADSDWRNIGLRAEDLNVSNGAYKGRTLYIRYSTQARQLWESLEKSYQVSLLGYP